MLVCGLLQRFQRSGVEEKGHDADEGDAVAVGPGLFVGVADLEEIPGVGHRFGELRERKRGLSFGFSCFEVLCKCTEVQSEGGGMKRFRKDKTMKRKIMALGAVLAWVCGVFGACFPHQTYVIRTVAYAAVFVFVPRV